MKKILSIVSGLFLTTSAFSQVATIGTGVINGQGVNYTPIYRSSNTSSFDWSRTSFLYTAAELSAAGIPAGATITVVEWDKNNDGATVTTTANIIFNILMKNSASTAYTAADTWGNLSTGATTVYATNNQVIPTASGFLPFNLMTPFVYSGNALEIMTDWDISAVPGNPTTGTSGAFGWNCSSIASRVLGTSAGSALTNASSLATQGNRPNIKITYLYNQLSDDVGLQGLTSPATTGCYTSSENVAVTIKNYGLNAATNIPVTVTVTGAVSQVLNATYMGSIPSNGTVTFTVGTINMTTAGTYSFNGTTSMAIDANNSNNGMSVQTRTVVAAVALPQTVSFTGYTGADLTTWFPNWYEGIGATFPTPNTASAWIQQTGVNGPSNVTGKINLYYINNHEWIVGPKFLATAASQLSFDAAVTDWLSTTAPDAMGSDDMVRVMVSTDCGVTYAPVFTVSATNSLSTTFTNFSVPLGAYSGQNIIVAFLAEDGPIDDPEDYDIHLDNINLSNVLPNDAGVSAFINPPTGQSCYSAAEPVSVTVKNYGSNSISNVPVKVIVSGAVSQTLTGTFAGPLAPTATANFTVGNLNMLTVGTYTFKAFTALAGDPTLANDTLLPVLTRTVTAPVAIPQTVNFNSYTGADLTTFFPNWYEAIGASLPTGTTAAWTSQTGLNTTGNITARLNMYGTARNEWIVGPKFTATAASNISFDAAVTNYASTTVGDAMGSDDKVRVMVSTNCGASFTPIFTVSAANALGTTFTNFSIPLNAYSGQNIIVAFLAQDGPIDDVEDYDFHLDNINLYNVSPNDVGVTSFSTPVAGACYSSAEPVNIVVKNIGSASQSNIPVKVIISGAITQTLTGTVPGPVAPSATVNFNIGNVNMSLPGTYNFKGFTSLVGDALATNDTSIISRVVTPTVALPQTVSFTGYTGADLTTWFPNWYEATGASVPTGTTSNWLQQTGLNGPGNITAKINLYTTSRVEWILGPKFTASANTQISFDAAVTDWLSTTAPDVMGSDDKLRVMVSTNCGASFTPIFTISATNSLTTNFTNFSVPLGAYAGQNIIVGFLATDGPIDDPEDYDIHLDNINLFNLVANDASAIALNSPSTTGCYSSSQPVSVTIKNNGTNAQTSIPVTVVVSGAITQTLNATYTGNLASTATVNFVVGNINMTTVGTYSFDAYTSLVGDQTPSNDAMIQTTRVVVGPVTLPQTVDFTNYSGADLTTWFPNWQEATGAAVPTGTISNWLQQTGLNGPGNVTAKINFYTTNRVEWILGPKFTATSASHITFDAAVTDWLSTTAPDVMGSDDMVRVMVSTNCGGSFTPIFTVSATNSLSTTFTNFNVSLSAYAGQDIIVGFLGQDGPVDDVEDYDFHLDNINISSCAPPSAPTSANTTVCTGNSATLTTVATGTAQWYATSTPTSYVATGNTFVTPVINANTTYYVRDSTACGLSSLTPVTISVTSQPTIVLGTSQSSVCAGGTVNIGATGATTYTWSTGANGALISPTVNATTIYTIVGQTTPGCSATASVTITAFAIPSVSATTSASLICNGQTASLTANGAATYSWSTASTNTVISVSPTVTTSYTVTGTSANGCKNTFVISQAVSPCTGINANVTTASGILVYPNPNTGEFTIELNNGSVKTIDVMDLTGRVVVSNTSSKDKVDFNINTLANGIYYVRIQSNNTVEVIKIVKQ